MIGVGLLLEDTAVDCGIAFSIGKNDMRNNRIFQFSGEEVGGKRGQRSDKQRSASQTGIEAIIWTEQ
jgi:hypothetical protein